MTHTDPGVNAYIVTSAAFAQPILKHLRSDELCTFELGCVVELFVWHRPQLDSFGTA